MAAFDAVVRVNPTDEIEQRAWGTVKVAYAITPSGLVPTGGATLQHDLWDEDREGPRWPPGSDYWPFKASTDVAVLGKAFAPHGRAVHERIVSLRVGEATKRVQVFGERAIEWTDTGPRPGTPEPFTALDLVYTNAYGGIDPHAELPRPRTLPDSLEMSANNPAIYPRNQSGKGYLIVDSRADGLFMPNLEDPDHQLTAENLLVRDPARWYRQPLSWFLDWHYPAMFPRAYWIGGRPSMPIPDSEVLEEVTRGFMPSAWRSLARNPLDGGGAPRAYFQEASLGMTFHDLREGTPFEVVGMHPERERMSFTLPRSPSSRSRSRATGSRSRRSCSTW